MNNLIPPLKVLGVFLIVLASKGIQLTDVASTSLS